MANTPFTSSNPFANPTPINLNFDLSPADSSLKDDPKPLDTGDTKDKDTDPTKSAGDVTKDKKDAAPKDDKSEDVDIDYSKINLDLSFGDNGDDDADTSGEGGDSSAPNEFVTLVNSFADTVFGGELEPYEGFDPEKEPDQETFIKLISHNLDISKANAVADFYSSLDPVTQKIVEYTLNQDSENPQEVINYIKTLTEENIITSYDVTNEFDQEKIVRTWYNNESWTPEEVEEKLSDLKESGLLEKEAKRIKPKLDSMAAKAAAEKDAEAKKAAQIKVQFKKEYEGKITTLMSSPKIGDIALNKETKQKLQDILLADEVEFPTPDGKKTKMPYLDALVAYHKYSPNANIGNLALAALLLSDREAFDAEYGKALNSKLANEFVKDHKYSNASKAGSIKVKDNRQVVPAQNGNKGWGDVFNKKK